MLLVHAREQSTAYLTTKALASGVVPDTRYLIRHASIIQTGATRLMRGQGSVEDAGRAFLCLDSSASKIFFMMTNVS